MRLEKLLAETASGGAAALCVVGEAGIGKSTLLEHAARRASGFQVLRVRGLRAEHDLSYAGLQLLCTPLFDELPSLEPGQRAALSTALGLSAGPPPEPARVGLALLNLLVGVAGVQPVCCIVDDADVLDRASRLVLAYVARRARRGGLLMLFAGSAQRHPTELDGLPELSLKPLAWDEARRLLAFTVPGRIDVAVAERILIESRGIPGAMIEILGGITAAELAGGYAVGPARHGRDDIADDCLSRAQQLPADAWRLLLVAAAEPTGEPTLLWRVGAALGVGPHASDVLQAHGYLAFGSRNAFRCARLRRAVYAAAAPAELRLVHRAIAEATDSEGDGDRRAWHLALSTSGLDDSVAGCLEHYAPAAFLERAAQLSAEPSSRGRRALTAAAAKQAAGSPEAAHRLLVIADAAGPDESRRAQIALQRARIVSTLCRDNSSSQPLLEAARGVEPYSQPLARQVHLEALLTAMAAGHRARGPHLREVAHAARSAVAKGPPQPVDLLLGALATRVLDGYAAATGPLSSALAALRDDDADTPAADPTWLAGCLAAELWDSRSWAAVTARGRLGMETGGIGNGYDSDLPLTLHALAQVALADVYCGRFDSAQAALTAADTLAAATGLAPVSYPSLLLAAWRGRRDTLADLLSESRPRSVQNGDGLWLTAASLAEAVLYNSVGDYERAQAAADAAADADQLALSGWALLELIEAAARTGAHHDAAAALVRLSDRADASATDWAAGSRAAGQAIMTKGPAAEALYQEAIDRLSRAGMRMHLSRAQVLYGEWLRRQGRRIDARVPLRSAIDSFTAIGADALAERARGELLASGEKARQRTVGTDRRLTPQESRIASLAFEGMTNPEIGTRLFVSPRTVEYHLHKVFAKLAITSRTELHLVLDTGQPVGLRGAALRMWPTEAVGS
jgi:DNA-binding CsgD family transcriptional regulator